MQDKHNTPCGEKKPKKPLKESDPENLVFDLKYIKTRIVL